jgi:CYTH domain-containing protein
VKSDAPEEKYSVREFERRFILPDIPAGVSDERRISDLYLDGTRLRVRLVATPGGVVLQRKLGQKRRIAEDDPTTIWHTSLYLNQAEYELLASLSGGTLIKTRWTIDVDRRRGAVDVFEGELAGLVLLEVDLVGFDDFHNFIPPTWVGTEVTTDETFTGGSLARLSAAEMTEILTSYE